MLRECDGFFYSISVTHGGAVLLCLKMNYNDTM